MSAQRTSVTSNQRVAAVPWIVSTVLQPTNASWTAMSSFWAEEPAEDEEERCDAAEIVEEKFISSAMATSTSRLALS